MPKLKKSTIKSPIFQASLECATEGFRFVTGANGKRVGREQTATQLKAASKDFFDIQYAPVETLTCFWTARVSDVVTWKWESKSIEDLKIEVERGRKAKAAANARERDAKAIAKATRKPPSGPRKTL